MPHWPHCNRNRTPASPMSALGQKRTFLEFWAMSALPPKADIRRHECDVRFVPEETADEPC
jgi:hypothetical protein